MTDTFYTIKSVAEGNYKEKGSKFLAFAYPVKNLDEVKQILEQKRKDFYDARHICYAYMLGAERTDFRANDDGEPSSTAGKPILGQINAANLTDVLIIVVRYFGGILLGTGGLTVAYKTAAAEAIAHAEIVCKQVTKTLRISFTYEQTNLAMRLIKELQVDIAERNFDAQLTHLTLTPVQSRYRQAFDTFKKNGISCSE